MASIEIERLTLRTCVGTEVVAAISTLGDGGAIAGISAMRDGKVVVGGDGKPIEGIVHRPIPVPNNEYGLRTYAHLHKVGATHYLPIDLTKSYLALDAENAELLDAAIIRGEERAKAIRGERDAARRAEILAAYAVLRVLCWSPSYSEYRLCEAYMPSDGDEVRKVVPPGVLVGVPGIDVVIDPSCPSLRDVKARSPGVGSFMGHENILLGVTDEDWGLLVAETANLAERRKVVFEVRADEMSQQLRAIEVPADAVVAYKRYRGDAELAWEREDEAATFLIRRYGDAIEAQSLASRGAVDVEPAIEADHRFAP